MKTQLILIVSEKMGGNKKQDRYEDRLIRMGSKARDNLGLKDEKTVELWPEGPASDRITRSKVLEIFQAYSDDLKKAKLTVPEEDYDKVGFVTSKIFKFICKDKAKKQKNSWIANTIEDTVVGADPEFLLMNGGSVKYAAEVPDFSHTDILGSDGPLAEIRPAPAVDVVEFVDSMKDILKNHENVKLIQQYKWMGGCYYYGQQDGTRRNRSWTLGGHIHIGTPARLARAISSFGGFYEKSVYSCLNKILDEYVATPMIKVDGIKDSVKRRAEYGEYGDIRLDHGRLEYRMLSGEWFTHPEMAKMVIGTVKAIAHSFFKILDEADYKHSMIMTKKQQSSNDQYDFKFFENDFDLWKDIEITKYFNATKDAVSMKRIFTDGEISFTKPYFTTLGKKLKDLPTYKGYSEHIDRFMELVSLSRNVLIRRDKDLKHTWVEGSDFII